MLASFIPLRCVRLHLSRLGPWVALMFALGTGVPRPGVYAHSHAGGDHVHVHGDDLGGLAELFASWCSAAGVAPNDHHGAHEHAHDRRPGIEDDDGPSTTHWHHQDTFQRVAIAAAPPVVSGTAIAWRPAHRPVRCPRAPSRDLRARGPPLSAVS
jgi:hypothetical protein